MGFNPDEIMDGGYFSGDGKHWATIIGGIAVGLIETFASYYFGVSWRDVISLSLLFSNYY